MEFQCSKFVLVIWLYLGLIEGLPVKKQNSRHLQQRWILPQAVQDKTDKRETGQAQRDSIPEIKKRWIPPLHKRFDNEPFNNKKWIPPLHLKINNEDDATHQITNARRWIPPVQKRESNRQSNAQRWVPPLNKRIQNRDHSESVLSNARRWIPPV